MSRYFVSITMMSLLLVSVVWSAEDIETQARKLEQQLMAPCCYQATIAQHQSDITWRMRKDIREKLNNGMPLEEIKAGYVEQFGKEVLVPSMPRVLILVGLMTLAVGLIVVLFTLKRFTARSQFTVPEISPAMMARIEQDLRKR